MVASVGSGAAPGCPFSPEKGESKSAALRQERLRFEEDAERIGSYERAREILLSRELLQGGGGAEKLGPGDLEALTVFYLDGAAHREKRASIARFFTPKAITERYHAIIERETQRLLAELRREGRIRLDVASFELTVAVAANIVGLTKSDIPKMARRLAIIMSAAFVHGHGLFARLTVGLRKSLNIATFYRSDVLPALRARRRAPQDDVLSHLLAQKASRRAILMECLTYAAGGMVTTREFIVMAAWHLLERPELRRDFLEADEERQFAILLEILRLEPIVSMLVRRTDPAPGGRSVHFAVDLRAVHADEAAVGACPHLLDPDRAKRMKTSGAFLSFGAGAHHCPGRQVALHEARIFLDALLRIPGIRLERAPEIGWSEMLMSYELRDAVVACDPA
ncbi:MAG: cytochrome P450 [Myxococcales bacterium]|nr:cytochrome P450 [Myxococcales bacterium]